MVERIAPHLRAKSPLTRQDQSRHGAMTKRRARDLKEGSTLEIRMFDNLNEIN